MKLRLWVTAMLVLATLFGGSQPIYAQAEQPSGIDNTDTAARAAKLQPVEMISDEQLAKLQPWERQVVDKMIQAAQYMNAAYWQQVDPEGQILFASLPAARDVQQQAEYLLVDANYGRWDRFDNFAPYLGAPQRPPGGYVYPIDLTKEELDAYIAAHPEQKEALLSPYTVVRRDGDQLTAVPYHEVYAEFVMPAADLLDEAAKLSQNVSLTDYLQKEAEALRTDEYYDADLAWLDVDSNLDLSVGPHEVYDDQLTGQKAFYKANVLIVDRAASALLDKFKAAVPELQANLPVPAEFRPDQTGTLTPMEMTDDIYRTGQARAVMEGVAFSLPNDPKVWEAKGAKKVIMRNFVDTRRRVVLDPLLKVVFDDEVNSWSSDDGYFNWLLMHEVSHSLGPRTVMKDGQEVTVRQALGEYYSPIEEGKADISGLYNVVYLREQGIDEASLESHYAGYLSEALRSARFGPSSAYGVIRSAAWNFFVEQGALVLDPTSEKFTVDVDKMTQAVKDLTIKLITIEGNGDADAAAAFLKEYSYISPDLQRFLDKANATVPVEFVPSFSVASVPSGTPTTEAPATTASITSTAATPSTDPIPLADAIADMEPQAVWQNFYDLTQVPRPSHHEEQATAFLSNFGEQLGLETTVNEVGDVIIRKPGSPGFEDAPVVILQGHMDMVAQKTPDSDHDFETDPIEAYVEDGWVHAISTTLGADDGIGVAMAMAILQDDSLVHPPLEAIFTTNEEDGFTGINGLVPSDLQASTYINIDWEQEGSFCISSAGGVYLDAVANYAEEPTPDGMAAYTVEIGGLQGGHSGQDINKGRGNANELIARLLWNAPAEMGLRLSNLTGGSVYNAISTDAFAVVVVPIAQTKAFEQMVTTFEETVQHELAATEPSLAVTATAVDLPKMVMDAAVQQALLGAVYGAPQGVLRMSDSVESLVETSDNIGIFSIDEGVYTVGDYVRSAVDSERDDAAARLTAVFELAATEVTTHGAYSSWPANPDSPILLLMQTVYEDLYGVAPEVTAVHAGLETSVAGAKNPELDMISVGPTLVDVHSPQERLEVASVEKVYALIVATLEAMTEE